MLPWKQWGFFPPTIWYRSKNLRNWEQKKKKPERHAEVFPALFFSRLAMLLLPTGRGKGHYIYGGQSVLPWTVSNIIKWQWNFCNGLIIKLKNHFFQGKIRALHFPSSLQLSLHKNYWRIIYVQILFKWQIFVSSWWRIHLSSLFTKVI